VAWLASGGASVILPRHDGQHPTGDGRPDGAGGLGRADRRGSLPDEQVARLNLNADDHRLLLPLDLARQLIGTPRHLSQHPDGFVLTQDRLDDLVPIEPARMADREIIEWDKDDIDALKFMKVDVLGLGMLGCMNRAFNLLEQTRVSRSAWPTSRTTIQPSTQ